MATVTVRDETATGRAIDQWPLAGLPERISARELVRLRVREEVARFNADRKDLFRGLVRPTDAEATWNGYRVGPGRRLDWERQADAACAAFARNGFVLLVGDRQVEDLDEEIDLLAEPDVAFVRLVALVGG
ncbi:hypothetical protein AB0B63_20775 [Micromonospora sp. NPDC049081]|uniref:hypothetical protein n=1 Tax=Micromonospora sp. NPDC049081 TaxID=3155150 RepID=UPI0033D27CD0